MKDIPYKGHLFSTILTTTIISAEWRYTYNLSTMNFEILLKRHSWSHAQLRPMDWRTKKICNLDTKAMNALFFMLNKEEFNRMSTATSMHQIWQYYRWHMKAKIKLKNLKFLFVCTVSNYSRWRRMKKLLKWLLDSLTSRTHL